MSALRREIARCMLAPPVAGDGVMAARYRFPAGFTGFQGHFPDKPVLPAVCMVQAVLVMFEQAQARTVELKSLVSAKWQAPVAPDAEIEVRAQAQPGDNGTTAVKARIMEGPRAVADMKLLVAFPADGKGGG